MADNASERYIEGLAQRIRACATRCGSGDQLSRATGIPRSTLESYLTGESEPKASRLVLIAHAAGVDLDWLLTGKEIATSVHLSHEQLQGFEEDRYAYIPLYDAYISQGHGGWVEGAKVLTKLAFTRHSLRNKGLEAAQLAAFRVAGDSNEPVLGDGDTVLVDLSIETLQADGFYVIRLDDLLYAKRLQRQFDGSILVISANQAYQTMTVPAQHLDSLQIIGRVVWAGGWMI